MPNGTHSELVLTMTRLKRMHHARKLRPNSPVRRRIAVKGAKREFLTHSIL
jgi:hypothetical protein